MTRTEFIDLLDAYWNAAYHEGEIAATTDTPDGRAGRINSALMREYDALAAQLTEARRVCDEQANDEGLWFMAVTVTEDYLQSALRRLHAAVEGTASQPPTAHGLDCQQHEDGSAQCTCGATPQPRPLTAAERSALDRAFARSITVLDPGIDATGDQPSVALKAAGPGRIVDDYRECQYCGCITNAKARACCAEGRDEDVPPRAADNGGAG